MAAQVIFIIYAVLAFSVAIISLLWGSNQKILGAALLLLSVILSNIILAIFVFIVHDIRNLTLSYVAMDLVLAYAFLIIFKSTSWLQRNRWALGLVIVHIGMAGVNFYGVFNINFGKSGEHGLALNILMIVAFIICIFGFTPKSRNEAKTILKTKLFYLKNDIFSRVKSIRKGHFLGRKEKASIHPMSQHIGLRVKTLRKNAELSQQQFAEMLGISQAQVTRIENGQNRVSATQLYVLTQIFKVEMDYFTEGYEVTADVKFSEV